MRLLRLRLVEVHTIIKAHCKQGRDDEFIFGVKDEERERKAAVQCKECEVVVM